MKSAGRENPDVRHRVAIVIPCYNEEVTVARVVSDFRKNLPEALIYVIDNNSTDATVQRALEAGASVIQEKRQGKGYAVQRMFEAVDADIYVMVDGDDTYPAENVHRLVEEIASNRADMAVGNRADALPESEMTRIRRFGNWMIAGLFNRLFRTNFRDPLSGYRAMSRDLVLYLPLLSKGFEVEIELTILALESGYGVVEVPIDYRERPEGSHSKLHVFKDGVRILRTMVGLLTGYRPLAFSGILALPVATGALTVWGIGPEGPVKIPLVFGLMLCALILLCFGFMLNLLNRRFREIHTVLRRRQMRR